MPPLRSVGVTHHEYVYHNALLFRLYITLSQCFHVFNLITLHPSFPGYTSTYHNAPIFSCLDIGLSQCTHVFSATTQPWNGPCFWTTYQTSTSACGRSTVMFIVAGWSWSNPALGAVISPPSSMRFTSSMTSYSTAALDTDTRLAYCVITMEGRQVSWGFEGAL